MGLIRERRYRPPVWLPGGHLQTIYPALFRKVEGVTYQRERLDTPDGDFLLLDWSVATPGQMSESLVILSHGFEGDSHRPYIKGAVQAMNKLGYDCLAWNYRSCGGVLNATCRFYHSGATDDLALIVSHGLARGYSKMGLIGFSLGGNLTLKYLGESRSRPAEVMKALCFSVPLDLEECSRHLDKPINWIYQKRFLNTLRLKIQEKSVTHPESIDKELLSQVSSVYSFDNLFTGPLHGYRGAQDYYSDCSAKNYLSGIEIPVLVVHALNDPMIPPSCLSLAHFSKLAGVDLRLSETGGHCGFPDASTGRVTFWSEKIASQFFTQTGLSAFG